MEKTKKRKRFKFRIISFIFACIFSAFTFSACFGGSSSSSNNANGGGQSTKFDPNDKSTWPPKDQVSDVFGNYDPPPKTGRQNSFSSVNDVFLGAICIYDVDSGDDKIFYDKPSEKLMSFNELIDRQFDALASILYGGLVSVYGSSVVSDIQIKGFKNDGGVINISCNDLISAEARTPLNNWVYYKNAMNGGYDFVVEEIKTTEKDPETDEDVEVIVHDFEYDTNVVLSENKWNVSDLNKDSLKEALKYIYCIVSDETTGPHFAPSTTSTSLDFSDTNLINKYSDESLIDFDSMKVGDINKIKTIGFTKDYMWNVLYFLAYTVIGQDNINNSNITKNFVNIAGNYSDGEELFSFLESESDNKDVDISVLMSSFEAYKAYDTVLLDLVNNAFKATINGTFDFSAFDVDSKGVSLYPQGIRQNILYYDDIEKIQDFDMGNTDGAGDHFADKEFDKDKLEEMGKQDNFDSDSAFKGEEVEGKYLRKLKSIILIPYLSDTFMTEKNGYTPEDFQIDEAYINIKAKSGESYNLAVLWAGKAQGEEIKSAAGEDYITGKYDDGSYKREGEVDENGKKQDDLVIESTVKNVTSEGYLMVTDSFTSDMLNTMKFSEEDLTKYKFKSAKSTIEDDTDTKDVDESDIVSIVGAAFTSASIFEETKDESFSYLNVQNRLMTFDIKDGKMTFNFGDNVLQAIFAYLNTGGGLLGSTPESYLMMFNLGG